MVLAGPGPMHDSELASCSFYSGGERRIRTLEVAIGSARCRFFFARSAVSASAPLRLARYCTLVVPNPEVNPRPRWRR